MSKQLKLRRGTTAQHSTFTGASGEVTVDTTKKTLVVHDGTTAGGLPLVRNGGSENVGIGTSSPLGTSAGRGNLTINGSTDAILSFGNANSLAGYILQDSGGMTINATGAVYQRFFTNGSERARIDSSGNLLVGLTSNTATFSSRLVLSYNSGTTQWGVGPWVNTPTNFYISANGGAQGVYLNGATATSWTGWSDERIKDELQPIENAAEKICTLRAVTGVFKEDETKTRKPFLIAQDVLAVLPEAVDTSNSERFGLSYTDTIPLLVAAIQEQQAIIEQLRADVEALKGGV